MEKLTGRSRHRVDDDGLLVLQVECEHVQRAPSFPFWRDAKVEDLSVRNRIPEVEL